MNAIQEIEKSYMREDLPDFRSGDTVAVHYKIKEGDRERIQIFEGVVIAKKGGGARETFIVRKVSYGVGVERIFALHSPLIDKIELKRLGKVRRAKLYYLRGLSKKASRIKERARLEHKNTEPKVKETAITQEPRAAEPEAAESQVEEMETQAPEETAEQATPETKAQETKEAPSEEAQAEEASAETTPEEAPSDDEEKEKS